MPEASPGQGLIRTDFHAAIRRNERHTLLLCFVMVLIAAALGYGVGWAAEVFSAPAPQFGYRDWLFVSRWGQYGAMAMLVLGTLWIVVAVTLGDRIVLAMVGAREVSAEEEPVLHNVVEEMALAAGLPKPKVAVLDSPALNAFATGLKPEKSAVAVTRGLLDTLTRPELQGVVAHEVGHIANNDVLYATAVGVIVGLVALVSDAALRIVRPTRYGYGYRTSRRSSSRSGGNAIAALLILLVFAILAPLAARLVQMAISREREYLADATAVKFTRNPLGLIGALEKIDGTPERFRGANRAIQHLFIANPFRKFGAADSALLSTHPPTAARIERLRDLG